MTDTRQGETPQGLGPEAVLERAAAWRQQGLEVVLATVIKTWGSSPRPVGSQMAVAADGAMAGSVSGGCIEAAVVEDARAAMRDGAPRLLSLKVSNEEAWALGLACGGAIEVFLEPVE